MFVPPATTKIIQDTACDMLSIDRNTSVEKFDRKMLACFGVSVGNCTFLWNALRIDRLLPEKTHYKHLLWSLAFLKTGSTEDQLSVWFNCDPKTLRKWVWDVVLAISRYEAVSTYFNIYIFH